MSFATWGPPKKSLGSVPAPIRGGSGTPPRDFFGGFTKLKSFKPSKSWRPILIRHLLFSLLIIFLFAGSGWAGEPVWNPEEPDYAFLTGSPYTENKKFLQLILTNLFQQFRNPGETQNLLTNSLRFEYGFTDRLEGDLVLPFNDSWEKTSGVSSNANGFGDTLLGLRYRFLNEASSPITLTFGPQLLPPTGKFRAGFGSGGLTLAWDLTMAKEWNRWFFTYFDLNYGTTFSAQDPTLGSTAHFNLNNFTGSVALGFRPLERDGKKGDHHCVHLYLEASGNLVQSVEVGSTQGTRTTQNTYLLAPGVRYGYMTKNKNLTEVGVAGVIGLGADSPTWGMILQTQFETGF